MKKFELIQFQKAPENPSVESVMEETTKSIQNPEFKLQSHIGFYCPKTGKEILLPEGYQQPPRIEILNDNDNNEEEQKQPQNDKSAATVSEQQEDEKATPAEDPPGIEMTEQENPSQTAELDTSMVQEEEKKEEEVRQEKPLASTEQPQKLDDDDFADTTDPKSVEEQMHDDDGESGNNVSAESADKSPEDSASGGEGTAETEISTPSLQEESKPEEESEMAEKEQEKEEVIMRGTKPSEEDSQSSTTNAGAPKDGKKTETKQKENPFDDVGPILVAIPKGYTLKEVSSLARMILQSPSFAILTVGNSVEQVENMTVEQELAQLKEKAVASVVSERLSNKATLNELSSKLNEKHDQDLEKRRKKRMENSAKTISKPDQHGLSPLDAMRVAQNQQKAASKQKATQITGASTDSLGLSPLDAMRVAQNQQKAASWKKANTHARASTDSHGLSPLDAMRVAQNKQKEAARQKERETREQYQRQSSSNSLLPSEEIGDSSKPDVVVVEEDVTSKKEMFVASSLEKRQSLKEKKEAELEAIRQQRSSPVAIKKHFVAKESSAEMKKASFGKQKENELAALRGKGFAKSWKPSGSVPNSPTPSRKENMMPPKVSSSRSIGDSKVLRQSSLFENTSSSHGGEVPPKMVKQNSNSELEELRGLGLAKSVKNQFTEFALENKKKTEEHLAQERDLEERKAKTSEFQASRNALSAADQKALSVTKFKKEDRAKDQKALGYHRDYDGIEGTQATGEEANKDWKTTGKVHTTQGQDKSSTKEWDAPEQDKMKAASLPKSSSSSPTTTMDKVPACACCIVM